MKNGEGSYIGVEIGNYRITKEIDAGGSGTVYLAEHAILTERLAAIKLLHAHLTSQEDRADFLREAQMLERLKHPHILPIYDVGFYQNVPYIITEYALGASLRDRLNQQPDQPLLWEEALSILTQVGQALQHAHEQEIVHRDLKPENILFNAKGVAFLADFGIAMEVKSTSIGNTTIIGSFEYMAPEQFQGIISKEGDQYALGCIAYELVTGHVPFEAPNIQTLLAMHMTATPATPRSTNPHLSPDVEQAILKALEKQRPNRHATVLTFLTALSASKRLDNILLVPPSSSSPEQKTKEQWLQEGHTQLKVSHPKKALSAYEQAFQLDPRDPEVSSHMGSASYQLHHYKKALEAYERVLQQKADHLVALTGKGDALSKLLRYFEALEAYDGALTLAPDNAELHNKRGNQLYHLNRMKEAVQAYEEAIRLRPTSGTYLANKGNALFFLTRYEDALTAYDQALNLETNHFQYRKRKADVLVALKRYDEAIMFYEQLVKEIYLPATKAEILSRKGDALYECKRYEEALAAYSQALRSAVGNPDLLEKKANTLFCLQRYEEAISVYSQAIRKLNTAVTHINKGNCHYNLKQYTLALEAFNRALHLAPDYTLAYECKAKTLMALKNYQEALATYEQILLVKPYDVLAVANKGVCLYQLQRYKQALDTYNRLLVLDPQSVAAYSGRGDVFIATKQYLAAITAYEKACQLEPTDFGLALQKAGALLKIEKASSEDRLNVYDYLLGIYPTLALYHVGKGEALLALQRYQEALTEFEHALLSDPNNTTATQGKAEALRRLPKQVRAVQQQVPPKAGEATTPRKKQWWNPFSSKDKS